MTMKTTIALAALTLTLLTPARAQLVLDFAGEDQLSVGPGTSGYEFTTGSQPLTLRTLGIWDADNDGLFNSHTVGLWDAATHTLLASALVQPSTAIRVGEFWYVNIAPLTLAAGHEYVLGASYADSDLDLAAGNATSATMGGGVTLGDPLLSTSSTFAYPDLSLPEARAGFFGPNAGFAAVPEPAALALVTTLSLAFLALHRRFTRHDPATNPGSLRHS